MELDLTRAQWKKSSYSGNSGNCVEVAQLGQGRRRLLLGARGE